jgi:hypothetical protein
MRKTEMFKEFDSGRQPFFELFSIFSQLFGLERTAVVGAKECLCEQPLLVNQKSRFRQKKYLNCNQPY